MPAVMNRCLPVAILSLGCCVAPIHANAATESAAVLNEPRVIEYVIERKLTLRPVTIDPLGADSAAPWRIHLNAINVRSVPGTEGKVLGRLELDAELSGAYLLIDETDEEWLEIDFSGRTGYVSRLGFSRVHPANLQMIEEHGNLPIGREVVNRWWGIPLDYEADDLVPLPPEITRDGEPGSFRLRKEAADSLVKMFEAMRADGIEAYVSSSYRSGETQQSIFLQRMRERLNQRGTAPPGHSEHQLGTTVDISSVPAGRRALKNGDPQHDWLRKHAAKYGWRQTYFAHNVEETGYIEEPWHWRYVGKPAPKSE